MSSHSVLACLAVLGGLMLPNAAFAQLVPQAGSAGAGNAAISGVPYGPANPSVIGDPSGIGNAARIPPLGSNAPAPPTSYGSVTVSPQGTRVVAPPSVSGSQRITIPNEVRTPQPGSGKTPVRPRGGTAVSRFTGICRGC